jgi:hypothetical protein
LESGWDGINHNFLFYFYSFTKYYHVKFNPFLHYVLVVPFLKQKLFIS